MENSFNNVANFIKYNRIIYSIYYVVLSKLMQLLGRTVTIDNKLILFNSFAGRKYDDSPKAIYEAAINDSRFAGYEFVWAFHDPSRFAPKKPKNGAILRTVCTNSLEYFLTALRAGVWVTNSSVERGLCFKKAKTFYFNTWHGTPIKKMGRDIPGDNGSFRSKGGSKFDVMMSQGRYETEIFSRAFDMPIERFLEAGLPRNDELSTVDVERAQQVRRGLGIPEGKKVALYCPTFREYSKDKNNAIVMSAPLHADKWKEELGGEYVVLVRAHYEVSKHLDFDDTGMFKDTTEYQSLNDLILASDVLISDYSSVIVDYSITGKPIILYTYDFDEYVAQRGMYIDVKSYFISSDTEDQLIEMLKNLDSREFESLTEKFRDQFVESYGNATKAALDCIIDSLSKVM